MPTPLVLPALHFTQSPNFSSRHGQAIRLIVVHDCEGSFDGSVAWFSTPQSQVSAHYVLDKTGARAMQMVDVADKAWHCVSFNAVSIGVEMEGFESKGFPDVELGAMANVVAFLLHTHGLPVRWAEGGEGSGFCRHFDLGQAGGGHDDPTTQDSVWQGFIDLVKAASASTMPADWRLVKSHAHLHFELPKGFTSTHRGLQDLEEGSPEWVQMNLNTLGVPKKLLAVDGQDNQDTRDAIAAFQAKHGLNATGVVDPDTISALKQAVQPVLEPQ
jgi:N-acetyl-anhydromuramyl-L-alanine amidase AmpD